MEYLIGTCLAATVLLLARFVGFDRDRAFYSLLLIVVASYYALFAVMSNSVAALVLESCVIVTFLTAAVLGFKRNLWILVAGFAAHGVFDVFHDHLISNPSVPTWWPGFCLTFDVAIAAGLAWAVAAKK
jgi:hypothetical protein